MHDILLNAQHYFVGNHLFSRLDLLKFVRNKICIEIINIFYNICETSVFVVVLRSPLKLPLRLTLKQLVRPNLSISELIHKFMDISQEGMFLFYF